jgi:anti-sigma factor (TIGR02949 family)
MTHDKGNNHIEDIDCTEAIGHLYAYLDDEIDDMESLAKLENHMKHCQSCFTRSEVERALSGRIQQATKMNAPASLQNRLRGLIEKF